MSIQKQMIEQLYSLAEKAQQPEQIKALQDQITKSIQNGAVPAYAAIPLVQDLTSRLQKAQTMQQTAGAQAQPQQPPIADQVLTQAQGIDSMPSNLPAEEQAYAAGGIVAFAEGDLVDDDETETEDDRQESALMSLMSAARSKIQNLRAALPQSYEATLAAQKTAPTAPAEGGLSGILSSVATKYGVPATLLSRVSGAESSGNATAANPRSSAKGLFQFTDATWKGMGGKEGEQFNPEINADLGAKYIRQNAEHLKKTLGRDPNFHEVYAAHMFGPGVSKMLNKANPKDPIERGLSMFQSSDMVKKIMKANPNLRGKSVGEVLDSLQSKTGTGIVPLAQGGAIKHFAKAGEVESGTENPYAMMGDIGASAGDYRETNIIDDLRKKFNIKTAKEAENEQRLATVTAEDRERQKQMEYQDLIEGSAGRNLIRPQVKGYETKEQMGPPVITSPTLPATLAAPQAPITEAVDPYLEKYMGMLQKRETEAEKQKELDAYLALMQAGLGMMGGSSPYAFQNIGQGGTQGLASYAAAQKQRAAEDAATLSGYGKLYTAKQAADLKRELSLENKDTALARLKQSKELAENKLKQDRELKIGNDIRHLEVQFGNMAERNIRTALGNTFNELGTDEKLKLIAEEKNRLMSQSDNLKRLYKEAGLPEVDVVGAAATPRLDKDALIKQAAENKKRLGYN